MATEASKSVLEISTVFTVYFLAQAYGYSHGHLRKQEFSVHEAVLFGARHLSNIVHPAGRVAWPLTPALCGPLLLLAVYLPSLGGHPTLVSALFVGTLCASYFALCSLFWNPDQPRPPFTWWLALRPFPFFQAVVYLSLYAAVILAWRAAGGQRVAERVIQLTAPADEIVAYALFGWLLFMTYLGSRFDGALDRVQHVHATEDGLPSRVFVGPASREKAK